MKITVYEMSNKAVKNDAAALQRDTDTVLN